MATCESTVGPQIVVPVTMPPATATPEDTGPVEIVVTEPVEIEVTEPATGPDLVIMSFEVLEPRWSRMGGGFSTGVRTVVKNVGSLPASGFEVSIVAVNREDVLTQFYVKYEPMLPAELGPGQEAELRGETGLVHHGRFDVTCSAEHYDANACAMSDQNTLLLKAIADYCAPDEGLDSCHVDEIDETNNESEPVVIQVRDILGWP